MSISVKAVDARHQTPAALVPSPAIGTSSSKQEYIIDASPSLTGSGARPSPPRSVAFVSGCRPTKLFPATSGLHPSPSRSPEFTPFCSATTRASLTVHGIAFPRLVWAFNTVLGSSSSSDEKALP
ncbi:hypothetical protein FALBO_7887 [Fusarium albosuccineum]|uniref:Uncharacterized protein n=1 Tax=Fusarium albosuccineum TaxID=1237068 RepID=A0A8H4P7G5_9HYPO|nr:hypothetical protein FALBO_7887 [Fusarium albosuccineum]